MDPISSLFDSIDGLMSYGIAGRLGVAVVDMLCVFAVLAAFAGAASLLEWGVKKLLSEPILPNGKPVLGYRRTQILEGHLTFPGVVYHECSHALFAVLTGAKVTGFSVIPHREDDGTTTLGSVTFVTRGSAALQALQRAMSAIAPAIMGFAGMAALVVFAIPACSAWWQWLLVAYALVCLAFHSELSDQDWRTGKAGIPFMALVLVVIFLLVPLTPSSFGWTGVAADEPVAAMTASEPGQSTSDEPSEEPSAGEWSGNFAGQVQVGS